MKYLIRRESMAQAVNNGRLHHQLIPMQIDYEDDVDAEVIEYLRGAGHAMNDHAGDGGFAAVTAIGALHEPEPFYDRRRVGSVLTITNTNKMNH